MASVNDHESKINKLSMLIAENNSKITTQEKLDSTTDPGVYIVSKEGGFDLPPLGNIYGYGFLYVMQDHNKAVCNQLYITHRSGMYYRQDWNSDIKNGQWKKLWMKGDAITGAVWNDYAEKFEKPIDLQTEPGDIISLDNNGNEEIYKLATEGDTNIVGVHSDEYGMLLGGTENEEYDKQHYIPVGMLGRVKTKIIGSINKGERIVPSNIPGIGRAYKDGDSLFSIVGYATETNLNTDIKKVRIKINTY